jgi:hypothetical protein
MDMVDLGGQKFQTDDRVSILSWLWSKNKPFMLLGSVMMEKCVSVKREYLEMKQEFVSSGQSRLNHPGVNDKVA